MYVWHVTLLELSRQLATCCYSLAANATILQATIGIDFLSKTMYLEDRTVRLQLWYADASKFYTPCCHHGFKNRTITAGTQLDRSDLGV